MNLFSTRIKEFLDQAIKFHPVGSTFHIRVETTEPCPFTVSQVEDQIRSVYGPLNNYMMFLAGDGGTFDSITESSNEMRKETMPWINGYLRGILPLDQGEVPPEVLHWLSSYRGRNQHLINYLTR